LFGLEATCEVAGGGGPGGEVEVEAVFQEEAGGDLTAFQDQLGFGAHGEGAYFEHPAGCGEADGLIPGLAECLHELAIGHGAGGGHIDDAVGFVGDLGVGEKEVGGAAVVEVVHPGDELFAGALCAAEA